MTARTKIIRANEDEPIKISLREILESSREPFMARTLNPKGGVSNPISTPNSETIPNQIKSPFKDITVGKANGTIINRIEVESISIPRKINKTK